ncbi:MAG: hypothetical protein ACREOI_10985 [bacterium]
MIKLSMFDDFSQPDEIRLMLNHQAQRWKAAEAALRWLIILRSLQQAFKILQQKETATKKIFSLK